MERLFIQLSDDVYISISKNWPLWLVLWSRVTFYISQCVFYFNIFCCCFFSQWYHPKIGLSTKGKKHIIFKSHCTLYLICHLIMCVIQTWYLHILVKRKILSQTVINRHIQYRYDMWLYSAHFHPQTCHEHNWNCYCELFMVIWFGGALRLIKVWFDYVLFAFIVAARAENRPSENCVCERRDSH